MRDVEKDDLNNTEGGNNNCIAGILKKPSIEADIKVEVNELLYRILKGETTLDEMEKLACEFTAKIIQHNEKFV